jgi:hypothetical protein
MYSTISKPVEKLTDDDLKDIELTYGHEFYCHIKKYKTFKLRNKKLHNILNRNK